MLRLRCPTVTVRVLYHREPDGWWAESPDIDGWTVAGETCDEVRALVDDGHHVRPRVGC
jgi:predicted RNase H-like HicB family nuclease